MQNKKSKNTKAPLKREIPANTIGRELDELQYGQASGDVVPFKKSHEKGKVEKKSDTEHDKHVNIKELEEEKHTLEKRLAEINKELAAARRDAPAAKADFTRVSAVPARDKRPTWSDKKARAGRNPVEFIKVVYKDELSAKTLTRAKLRQVDFPLAQAFDKWVSRHSEDKELIPSDRPIHEQHSDRPALTGAERTARYRARLMSVTLRT